MYKYIITTLMLFCISITLFAGGGSTLVGTKITDDRICDTSEYYYFKQSDYR